MRLQLLNLFQKIDSTISYLFGNHFNEKIFLKHQLQKNNVIFFDVGSNLGSEIKFINKNFASKIYSFEPDKKNFEYLKKNFTSENINLYNLALSNESANKKFYAYDVSSQSSLYKPNIEDQFINKVIDEYNIKTETLDNFIALNNIDKIDYLKIDTQGEDLKILEGASENLKENKIKLIKIEISISNNWNSEIDQNDFFKIIKLLKNNGYKLKTISKIKYKKDNTINFFDAYFSLNI